MGPRKNSFLLATAMLLVALSPLTGVSAEKEIRFNRDIRPILSDKCFFCHGFDGAERKAGLRLDTREGATAVRDGITPIVPGSPDESEIIVRITLPKGDDDAMPPANAHKSALTKNEIDLIRKWIEQGATYEDHWAFTEAERPDVPKDAGEKWARGDIDHFIASKHKREGISPAPEADPRTLVRRLHFDLIGLPPKTEIVTKFQKDNSDAAYDKLVDDLLASPQFGERMAVFWLDLVRYADTVGLHGDQNVNVSVYRDYVIRAFNKNIPFDQFTIEQIAGDLLEDPSPIQLAATAYNRLNLTTHEGGAQRKEYEHIYGVDRVRNVSSAWMGVTLGCAECHDHKFDPLAQKDFYTMKAFFADLQEDPIFKGAPNANPTRREPEIDLPGYELMDQVEKIWLSTKDKAGRDKELAPLRKQFRRTLISKTSDPEIVRVLARGSWMDETGEIVDPAVPVALVDSQPKPRQGERLSRLDLAEWLVDRKNPLTARVFVNRLWRQFHGVGLSKVLDDLGNQGEWPVHPELLDWLAVEFMESGWDVKHLVKLMVSSSTYRQSSALRPELKDRDPFNRLVARQSNWRLPAEMLRDNILELSGLLHHQLGGPSVRPYQPAGYYAHLNFPPRKYQASKGKDLYRRGLYTHWQRMFVHPAMLAFDAPTREECIAERPTSNTPLAPLVMLNDPSYVEAARSFATNAIKLAPEGGEKRVAWMFQQALNRLPSAEEMEIVKELVRSEATRFEADPKAAGELVAIGELPAPEGIEAKELATWMVLARTLHNLHETITRM